MLAGVALGLALTFAPSFVSAAEHACLFRTCCHGSPTDTAKTDTKTLVQVIDTWRLNHPASTECPTVARLKADGALKRSQDTNDPWGSPYVMFCPHDDDVVVMSAGPDARYGTADDITAGDSK